jgi:hypothetical protein
MNAGGRLGAYQSVPSASAPIPQPSFAQTLDRIANINSSLTNLADRLGALTDRVVGSRPKSVGEGVGKNSAPGYVGQSNEFLSNTENLITALRQEIETLEGAL